uniref:mannosyl-glycoprotein endo-beta-N-acetylglucosaminidase n=1 Tax=Physcomitrium patens TaxID=3218 RepID=A0A7I4FNY7_PHYPA
MPATNMVFRSSELLLPNGHAVRRCAGSSLPVQKLAVNIENKVDTKDLPRLHLFLQHLRQCMHTLKPNSDVIWYDAVTDEGDLDWQNCLNEKNRSFFAVSDGLFTNYTWSEGMAKLSANAAGERNFEVYMGVDVFGRNTFGGGGFDCDKALKVAREGEVSAALFAPAWVYETNQPPSFEIAQSRWWSRIEDCWPIARCSPIALPFFTDFNRGCGTRVAVEGKEVSTQPWFNLSCQNLQPILKVIALSESPLEVSMSHEAAYSGGSCIKLTGSDDSQGLVLLYECNVPVKTREIHTSYCVHVDDQLHICIALIIHRESSRIVVLLVEEGSQVQVPSTLKNCVVQQATRKADLETLNSESNKWIVRKHVLELGICALSQIYAVTYSHELDVKKLISLVEDNTLTTRTLITDSVAGSKDPEILHGMLGHLRISTEREHDRELPNIVFEGCEPQWTQKSEAWKSVSLTLRWGLVQMHSSPGNCQWVQYHVYISKDGESRGCSVSRGDPEFLGVSVVKAFSVQDLLISSSCTMLNFHVQAHCTCGLPGALTAPCIVSNSNSNPSSHLDSDISGPVLNKHAV